jgi:hypothetical protein
MCPVKACNDTGKSGGDTYTFMYCTDVKLQKPKPYTLYPESHESLNPKKP